MNVPAWLAGGFAAIMASAPSAVVQTDIADGQWWQAQWEMDDVWRITEGAGVTVAVLDTGVDASVLELSGAMVPGTDLVDAGGDGSVDHDTEGHGTGTATLIAGRDGDRGFRGVAPAASVMSVAVLPGKDSPAKVHTDGIRFAVDNGADIINLSIEVPGTCPDLDIDAMRYAADHDVVVVASSGNDADGLSAAPGNCPGALTVGATDRQLNPWQNSHRSEHVDVAAAGVKVSSIGPGGEAYGGSGTSTSAALVSGSIALVRAAFPEES